MTVFRSKLMATCAVAALVATIYGCSSNSEESRLRTELDAANMEVAEAQMAKEMAEQRAAEAETAKMIAEQSQMVAEEARAEAVRLRLEAEEAARMARDDAARLSREADAAEQRATDAEADAVAARGELRLAREALADAETELEAFRAAQMMREQEDQARMNAEASVGLPGGIARSPAPAVYADSDQDTLANLLPGGVTEFAPLSVAVRQQYSGSDRGTRQPDSGAAYVKSISSDGANGFRVNYVIGGIVSHVDFTADDWNEQYFAYFDNSGPASIQHWLYSFTGSFYDDQNDRTSGSSEFAYFDINGWSVSFGNVNFEGRTIYGARTRPENMPTGSATYKGRMSANIWEGDLPDYPADRTNVYGALMLNANFDSSEISGQVDEFSTQVVDFSAPSKPMAAGNSIDISNGVIDGGRFSADWSGSGPTNVAPLETVSGFDGTMFGEFYGPAAEEVGGVMSGHRAGTGATPDRYFTGSFGGSQPEPVVEQ